MPILGMDIPESLVVATREALTRELNASAELHKIFPASTSFFLRRTPYTGDYSVYERTGSAYTLIAKFGMLPMPGCRAICIFHHVETEPEFRHKGIGRELLIIRLKVAAEVGYRLVICTVNSENRYEDDLLISQQFQASGWYLNKDKKMVYLQRRSLP